jgi:cytochrome c biogenesis protein CcmG/thiol:disulfide interchange protein DsbE
MRWHGLILIVAILGAIWTALSAVPAGSAEGRRAPSPRAGFQAPPFSLDRLGAEPVSLIDLRGSVVVINLWASWCPPCRAEMPALQKVSTDFAAEDLVILGVHMTAQDSETNAAAFVSEYNLSFPILLDRKGEVGRLYQSRALPTTYFLDRDGIIQRVIVGGPLNEVTLRSIIETLLEEGGA